MHAPRSARFGLAAAALLLLAACSNDAKSVIVGSWDVETSSQDDIARQFGLTVQIDKDGTFAISGGRNFEAMVGVKEVKGTYEFVGDLTLRVAMEKNPFNHQPTDYSLKINSKNELLLDAQDYTVTLKRLK